ncbi:beta-N-acetylhexosaminidase [Paenibacillus pini]|uniref:beta-N-acetylhexosaminidase n=1 Tax=Paenibacillus pini TaxID=669461 RepID=UPI001F58AAE1|nr:beta-N-acetylhexosaminidase [Paenibacillus pini]
MTILSGCGENAVSQTPEPATPNNANTNTNHTSSTPPPSEPNPNPVPDDPALEKLSQMTVEEKIGQLVLVGVDGLEVNPNTTTLIQKYKVGGIIFYKSNIKDTEQALKFMNEIKNINRENPVPLWMSVDEEGGRVSRMPEEFFKLPTSRAIGKVNNEDLSKGIGEILGRELAGFGLNMDFAPVLDINSNPRNPVIGDRSFGNNAALVSKLGMATMEGLRSQNVVPVVKHFPGHGDTSVDSHLGLPVVNYDITRLRKLELVPFIDAIKKKAEVVMIAHLLMPKLDAKQPASFSKAIISDLLRGELGFQGVVISDDMTMGAIEQNYSIETASVQAILAGGNIVLVGHEFEKEKKAILALRKAVSDGTLSEDVLNNRVYAILKLKQAYGINNELAAGPDVTSIKSDTRNLLKKYGLNH